MRREVQQNAAVRFRTPTPQRLPRRAAGLGAKKIQRN